MSLEYVRNAHSSLFLQVQAIRCSWDGGAISLFKATLTYLHQRFFAFIVPRPCAFPMPIIHTAVRPVDHLTQTQGHSSSHAFLIFLVATLEIRLIVLIVSWRNCNSDSTDIPGRARIMPDVRATTSFNKSQQKTRRGYEIMFDRFRFSVLAMTSEHHSESVCSMFTAGFKGDWRALIFWLPIAHRHEIETSEKKVVSKPL